MNTIQTRAPTFFAGTIYGNKQALYGWIYDFVGVLIFDSNGVLIESKKIPLNIDPKAGLGPTVESIVDLKLDSIRRDLEIVDGPIQVAQFDVKAWNIGLRQFPLDLEDFLKNPDGFSEEDADILRNDIDAWKNAGRCVLHWGNDYLLGRDGYTI